MKARTVMYVDYNNKEQCKWINNIARFVTLEYVTSVYSDGKQVGIILDPKNMFRRFIIHKSNRFLNEKDMVNKSFWA